MSALDLFGTERGAPARSLRPLEAPVALDLFSAAAETRALRSGRPLSQERAEIVAPQTAGPGLRCIFDHAMRTKRGIPYCPTCDA
jgi:hypothetical protein